MRQQLLYHILFMLLSPFLSLYVAFQSRAPWLKRWALISFITFYGSIIILSQSNDGFRHQSRVYTDYYGMGFDVFFAEAFRILTLQQTVFAQEDLYIHTISFFCGSILSMPGVFFVFVAFVYAYFFVGSIFRLFTVFPKYRNGILFFGLAIVFLLWKNIEGINTVRTWTGLWVLFYACISYYQTRKTKYLFLMFAPPFIHVGYYAMAVPAWIVLFFGNYKMLYAILFSLSFSFTIINPTAVTRQLERTEVGATKVEGYYTENARSSLETLNARVLQNKAWYLRFYKAGIQDWGIAVVAVGMLLFGTYFRHMNFVESSLFSIGLLTKVLSNSTWFLTALNNRSAIVAGLFLLAPVLLLWQRGYFNQDQPRIKTQRIVLNFGLLLLVPFMVYRVADLIYFVSVYIFAAPFIPWLDSALNMSIRETIGILLDLL